MNVAHIIAVLFALIGVVPALTLASPVRVPHRAVPTIMIIASLALWFLPTGIDIAVALVPVAAWISARLGIEHAGHEPADYSAAAEQVKSVSSTLKAKAVTVSRLRAPVPPTPVTDFVKHAYPDPATVTDDADAPGDDPAADADAPVPAAKPKGNPEIWRKRLAEISSPDNWVNGRSLS